MQHRSRPKLSMLVVMGLMLAAALAMSPSPARAQDADTLLQGLINVNVQDVRTNINDFKVVNVRNVLNNNEINVLNNSINNSPIASQNQNFLNNLLREAKLLNKNQIVVGVLSDQKTIYRLTRPAARDKTRGKNKK